MGADDGKGQDEGLSETVAGMRAAQPYLDAVWRFIGSVAVGVIGGYFADKGFGTTPWFFLGLSTLGLGVGLYAFLRTLMRMGKK